MKKKSILLIIFISLFMVCCSELPAENLEVVNTLEITASPDPCLEPVLSNEVSKVNAFMREFDDFATLASNTPQSQLVVVIPDLQRVLREAEAQTVPSCLIKLKNLQLQHMKIVVQTLLSFMGNSVNTELVNTSIAKARELHLQYDLELARLLGITLRAPASPTVATDSAPTTIPPIILSNPGPNAINLWDAPSFNAPVIAVLAVQSTVIAIGRTTDNQWVQVQHPNQPEVTAWVIASISQLSAPIEQLPITSP